MRHFLKLVAIFAGLTLATTTRSEAGIPIPCTGDKIFKVADLPAELKRPDGVKVDLGYMVSGCFSGRWIGYVGSSSQYLDLFKPASPGNLSSLAVMVAAGWLPAMPEEPGFWSSAWSHPGAFWAEWLWLVLAPLIGLTALFKQKTSDTGLTASNVAPTPAAAAPARQQPAASAVAAARIARAMGPSGAAAPFGKR